MLIESEGELYQLRYDNFGQAKIVSQVTKESMREQLISQFEKDKDFAEDQLADIKQGLTTRKGEVFYVWTRKFKSTEVYRVLQLDNDVKTIVINVADDTRCSYALVNNFLVRHNEGTDLLEVYPLSFKQGKLEDGTPTKEFNKVLRIKFDDSMKKSKFECMQAVPRGS